MSQNGTVRVWNLCLNRFSRSSFGHPDQTGRTDDRNRSRDAQLVVVHGQALHQLIAGQVAEDLCTWPELGVEDLYKRSQWEDRRIHEEETAIIL